MYNLRALELGYELLKGKSLYRGDTGYYISYNSSHSSVSKNLKNLVEVERLLHGHTELRLVTSQLCNLPKWFTDRYHWHVLNWDAQIKTRLLSELD